MAKRKRIRYPFDKHYTTKKEISFYPIDCAVLAFDVVGFTKGTKHPEMRKILHAIDDAIKDVMYETYDWNEVYEVEVEGCKLHNDVIMIPTGDGYAIAFLPEIDKLEILKIAKNLSVHMKEQKADTRMGLAFGPGMVHTDWNDLPNMFGYNINTATRIMSLARNNQILVDKNFAHPLIMEGEAPELSYAGKFKIKYSKVDIYNYWKPREFGNPRLPKVK